MASARLRTAVLLLCGLLWARRASGRALDADTQRGRCAELAAPWQENADPGPEDGSPLQLRVRPFSPGPPRGLLFPGTALLGFVRRVYRCCQERVSCRSVRGIPGRPRGGSGVEFLLTRDILSLTVTRAELHLQLSNPQHLDVRPVLSAVAKHGLPTRYGLWARGDATELRVDLLALLQGLQGAAPSVGNIRQVAPQEKPASGALELQLGLVLDCRRAGSSVSCRSGGVQLSHTPFMAVFYR